MTSQPHCPTCRAGLQNLDGRLACDNGHRFTAEGLALAGNQGAVHALWRAVLALEDDAAGLEWMLREDRTAAQQRDNYERQAAEGRAAAAVLRRHAQAAQERLDSLPSAPSKLSGEHDGSTDGG